MEVQTVARPAAPSGDRTSQPANRHVGLTHEPALDGLRGVAVAAVVVFHLGHLQGGFLGVDLFFVLSGFLITSLLLAEQGRDGRINLVRFWERRGRRLLPALFVMLAAVALLSMALTPVAERTGFRGDAFSTLAYVANWRQADAQLSYWDIFQQPSPLDHTWSLAIEEQFYLVWPLLVVGLLVVSARRAKVVGAVALVGAALSFALLAARFEPLATNRPYYGTDTRLGATLLGAALAAFALPRPRPGTRAAAVLDLAGAACLAFLVVSLVAVNGTSSWYYRGGLALFVAAALVVIVAVTDRRDGLLTRGLSLAPLRLLGLISYGVYLWHWPAIVFATPDRVHLDGFGLALVRVALTLALATVSYVVVEQPIRRGWMPGWRVVGVGGAAGAVTVAAVVIATSGLPGPAPAAPADPVAAAAAAEDSGEMNPFYHLPADVGAGSPKLFLVGDSGAAGNGLGGELMRTGEADDVRVGYSAVWCSVLNVEPASLDTSTDQVFNRTWCPFDRRATWTELLAEYDPDVVVYYLAWAGDVYKERLGDEWVWDCDEAYDAYLRTELAADLDLLASGGATVVLATSPYAGHDDESSRRRVDCRNDTYRAVAAARPGTWIVEMNEFVETESAGSDRDDWFVDNVHLSPQGAETVANWLIPELLAVL